MVIDRPHSEACTFSHFENKKKFLTCVKEWELYTESSISIQRIMRPEFSYFLDDWIIDLIETGSLVFRGSLPLSVSQILRNKKLW